MLYKVNKLTGERTKLSDNESVIINNGLLVADGVIPNNPFKSILTHTSAVKWIIENRDLVIGNIRTLHKSLHELPYTEMDVLETYGSALDYFSDPVREFRSDYFEGKGESRGAYNIAQYCMTHLKYVVLNYKKQTLMARMEIGEVSLLNTSEYESYGGGVVESTVSSSSSGIPTVEESLDHLLNDEDYQRYDKIYYDLSRHRAYYDQFDYGEFNVADYIREMYLDVHYDDIKEQQEHVSNTLGMSLDLVRYLFNDFRRECLAGEFLALDLYEDIAELIQGKKEGWNLPPKKEGVPN